jgi:hypothetical protein
MKAVLIAFSVVLSFSCSKNIVKNNSLVGKWKLVEYYMDPGDGSGTWKADNTGSNFIEFKPDGNYISTDSSNTTVMKYKIIDSVSVRFIRTNSREDYTHRYELTDNNTVLYLYPPCIEGCGLKYKAVH